MTTETDLKQRLATLNRTLAEATEACPGCYDKDTPLEDGRRPHLPRCKGTGEVARFPEFRQVCSWCRGKKRILKHILVLDDGSGQPYVPTDKDYDPCTHCNGRGWQVRAGDSADGLAGLPPGQAANVLWTFQHWVNCVRPYSHLETDGEAVECESRLTMPSALKIRGKELELICDAAGLDDDGELKPGVVERLRASLDTPREELLTADQMRQKLDDDAAGLEVPDA